MATLTMEQALGAIRAAVGKATGNRVSFEHRHR